MKNFPDKIEDLEKSALSRERAKTLYQNSTHFAEFKKSQLTKRWGTVDQAGKEVWGKNSYHKKTLQAIEAGVRCTYCKNTSFLKLNVTEAKTSEEMIKRSDMGTIKTTKAGLRQGAANIGRGIAKGHSKPTVKTHKKYLFEDNRTVPSLLGKCNQLEVIHDPPGGLYPIRILVLATTKRRLRPLPLLLPFPTALQQACKCLQGLRLKRRLLLGRYLITSTHGRRRFPNHVASGGSPPVSSHSFAGSGKTFSRPVQTCRPASGSSGLPSIFSSMRRLHLEDCSKYAFSS